MWVESAAGLTQLFHVGVEEADDPLGIAGGFEVSTTVRGVRERDLGVRYASFVQCVLEQLTLAETDVAVLAAVLDQERRVSRIDVGDRVGLFDLGRNLRQRRAQVEALEARAGVVIDVTGRAALSSTLAIEKRQAA